MEGAATAWTKVLAGVSRAEEATMRVTNQALDAFAVTVSRQYGVSYHDLMRIKHDVLGTVCIVPKASEEKTPCLGRTVTGARCKVQCHEEYCAVHHAQGDAALARQREIEAYVDQRQKIKKKTPKYMIPVVRHVSFRHV